MNEFMYA
jgi:hypothetical protein